MSYIIIVNIQEYIYDYDTWQNVLYWIHSDKAQFANHIKIKKNISQKWVKYENDIEIIPNSYQHT